MKAPRTDAGMLAACAVAVLLCGCTRTPAYPGGHADAAPPRRTGPPVRPVPPVRAAARHVPAAPTAPGAAAASIPVPAAAAAIAAPAAPAGANPFGAISWQPAPVPKALADAPAAAPPALPAPASAPAPPPVAPPLPFRFLGRYGDGQVQSVMLVKGERLYLARPGDTIDGAYRIDAVTAQSVELTYLPMQLKQSLGTGDAG
jgi:hypothetical protein